MSEPPAGVGKPDDYLVYRNCQRVFCPYCGTEYVWTDDIRMAREAEAKSGLWKPEYRLGIIVAGREPIVLVQCKGTCHRPYVAKFEDYAKENKEREDTWWKDQGRYDPKNHISGELVQTPARVFLKPKWVAIPVSKFVQEVDLERNPFIRAAIVRRVEAENWHIFPPGFERVPPKETLPIDEGPAAAPPPGPTEP